MIPEVALPAWILCQCSSTSCLESPSLCMRHRDVPRAAGSAGPAGGRGGNEGTSGLDHALFQQHPLPAHIKGLPADEHFHGFQSVACALAVLLEPPSPCLSLGGHSSGAGAAPCPGAEWCWLSRTQPCPGPVSALFFKDYLYSFSRTECESNTQYQGSFGGRVRATHFFIKIIIAQLLYLKVCT